MESAPSSLRAERLIVSQAAQAEIALTKTRCCARYCAWVVANGSMAGLQCGSRAVRQYSRIAGRKNGSSGEKEEKQYGMALLGFRIVEAVDVPRRSQSIVVYPRGWL